jgi:CheY-like chemotaxis protein
MAADRMADAHRLIGDQANQAGRFDVIAWVNPDHDPSPAPESDAALQVGNMAIRGIWGRVLKDGRSHIINEPGPDPDAPAVPEGYPPLTCFLGVPLRYAGKILGTIALVNKPSGYDDIDQEAMEALSPVIVAALIHKRAELSLREAQQQRIRHEQLAVLRQLAGGRDREMPAWIRRVHEALLSCLGRGRTRASSVPGRLRRSLTYASNAHDSPRKVLIASPRPALQEAVKSALRSEDQATVVETVNVGEEGLRIARDTRPDVIVVDLGSAGMGGFRTISLLRDQLSDARIIAVGPCDTKSAKITARECGADRLVLGSLQGRDLVQAIRRAILPR